jgi:hypothetical protein
MGVGSQSISTRVQGIAWATPPQRLNEAPCNCRASKHHLSARDYLLLEFDLSFSAALTEIGNKWPDY